jgi:hypothetical protein
MKPDINAYKILCLEQTYFVLDPYDLYAMPCLKITGGGHANKLAAEMYRKEKFNRDMKTYERLKELGRGFPDND